MSNPGQHPSSSCLPVRCWQVLSSSRCATSYIARTAQISDGLVYRYFRNKRELLDEVLKKFYERILLDLETQAFKRDACPARLEAWIRRHLRVFVADTGVCRLLTSEVRTASGYEGSSIRKLNRQC